MRPVFADSFYWVALTNTHDGFHERALALTRSLRFSRIITTEQVLAEYLKKHDGNVGSTAEALGITRRALEMKMAAHRLREGAAAMREKAGTPGPRG